MNEIEKQAVEEMAKDIGIAFQLSGTTRFGAVAEILVEQGYRNVKDKIVIPEKITEETSPEDIIKIAKYNEKVRKETARDIIDKVDDMIGGKMIAQALREIYEVE